MSILTKDSGNIYKNPNGDKFECLKKIIYSGNESADGYFFGQGKTGDRNGYIGLAIVIFFVIIFAVLNFMDADKNGDNIVSNIIRIFGFSFYNIIFLLIIFVSAPFGYQFWAGRCKNNHPGSLLIKNSKIDALLGTIPFIASIILVIYPTAMVLSGNLTHWFHKASLVGIVAIFGAYSATEYWPAFIKNTFSKKNCVTGTGKYNPDIMSGVFYLGFAAIAGFVILLSICWVKMAVTKKIEVVHGLNPIGMIQNLLITVGLFLTNFFGGLKLYEAKDYKINLSN